MLLVLLLACADHEALCNAGDPSVDAASCWNQGWDRGWWEGNDEAYDYGYDEGYATCLEDNGVY